jgi:homoserine dehydrogenase
LRVSGKLVQPKAIEYLRDRKYRAVVAALLQAKGTEIGCASNSVCDLPAEAPLKVLLLGLGQVGQGVSQHLQSLADYFEITGILVRDPRKSRDVAVAEGLLTTDSEELLKRPHQLIIDGCGDASLARQAIETALAAGCPAVTSSKRLVAEHGPGLRRLAAKHGTRIRYAAAVGGAAPMLEALERAWSTVRLPGCAAY